MKNSMEIYKNQKGITLVALVITIMLIKPSQYFSTIGVMGYAQFFLVICSFIMIVCRKDKRGNIAKLS